MNDVDYVNLYIQKLLDEATTNYKNKIILETRIKVLENNLQAKEKENEELQKTVEGTNNILAQATSSIEQLTNKKISLENDLQKITSEKVELKHRYNEKHAESEARNRELQDFKNELARQTNEMSIMFKELQELKEKQVPVILEEPKIKQPIKKKTKEIYSEDTF